MIHVLITNKMEKKDTTTPIDVTQYMAGSYPDDYLLFLMENKMIKIPQEAAIELAMAHISGKRSEIDLESCAVLAAAADSPEIWKSRAVYDVWAPAIKKYLIDRDAHRKLIYEHLSRNSRLPDWANRAKTEEILCITTVEETTEFFEGEKIRE